MKKDPIIYIEHIHACIQRIISYTHNFNEEKFIQNNLIQDAVIRNFEIIGEATKKLNDDFRSKYPEIEWKKLQECETNSSTIILGLIFGLYGRL